MRIADGTVPLSLDDAGGSADAGKEPGEGGAELVVVELVEVRCSTGITIAEGDGLEVDEKEIGGVGLGRGCFLGPPPDEVGLGSSLAEDVSVNGVGVEVAWTDLVPVVEEGVVAPADVEAVLVGVVRDEEK